jgi:L-alanine-DL-glutamate epimerase-like enolase superfamily enzyme
MRITSVEPLQCNAGWTAWTFVKITTDDGIVGYGECTDWRAPHALAGGVRDLAPLVVGQDPGGVRAIVRDLSRHIQQSTGGLLQKCIAGIELALWDIQGKALGVPVYQLFGGPTRDCVQLYWSHFGSYRARYAGHLRTPPPRTWEDISELGREAVRRGYTALKTNILAPGMAADFWTRDDSNIDSGVLETAVELIDTLRSAVGPRVDICLDLNFRFRPEACIRLAHALEPYALRWLEVDMYDPKALRDIRDAAPMPVASLESLNTVQDFLPFLRHHAADIAIVDVPWNGFVQSVEIASLAAVHETNVAPHNYYSHLATFIAAHWSACVTNLAMMETDVDSVPWRDDVVTNLPTIIDGHMQIPNAPGWGTDLDEKQIARHSIPDAPPRI